MLSYVAAAEGIHISLKAEPLFHLGPLTVTNSIVYGLVCAALLIALLMMVQRRVSLRPSKSHLVGIVEMMVEYILNLLTGPFGSREKAARFAPIFGVFFVFIMFNNLMGILPVVGPTIHLGGTPLFRPFTADINGTIAMSVLAIIFVQYLSIREQGGKKHLQHYFSDKPFNPLNFFIGILEVFGELTRILSLSLRLFLNTAVGEILIAVFTSMIIAHGRTPLAVIPILMFELLVAFIQAYVFTILTGTYLGLAISHHDEHDAHHEAGQSPSSVELSANSADFSLRSSRDVSSIHLAPVLNKKSASSSEHVRHGLFATGTGHDFGKKSVLEPESHFLGEESQRNVSAIRRARTAAKKLVYGQEARGSRAPLENSLADTGFFVDHHSPVTSNEPASG